MSQDSTLGAALPGASYSPPDARAFAAAKVPPMLPCSDCRDMMRLQYFALNGRPVCTKCKATYQARVDRGTGPAAMRRAVLYGSGAALGGAAGLAAVVLVVGFGRIPMSIGIAWMIATAIGKATDAYGGRRYQILAVTLTYLAIGLGSLAPIVGALRKIDHVKAPPAVARRTGSAGEEAAFREEMFDPAADARADRRLDDPAAFRAHADSLAAAESAERLAEARRVERNRSPESRSASRLTGGGAAFALGLVLLLFTAPLMSLFTFGIYGAVISIFAFGYGMKRAWEMTERGVDWQIQGPFRVGTGPIQPTVGG
jgi:hypothetical protein